MAAEEILGLVFQNEVADAVEPACTPGPIWSSAVP